MKLKNHTSQRFGRDGFLGIFGHKVDLLDHYEKKLEDVEHNVRLEQSSLAGKVCYSSFARACVCIHNPSRRFDNEKNNVMNSVFRMEAT